MLTTQARTTPLPSAVPSPEATVGAGQAPNKRELRGMSFAEGEQALRPVQMMEGPGAPSPVQDEAAPESTADPATLNAARIDALKRDLELEQADNQRTATELAPAIEALDEKLKTATGAEKAELEAAKKTLKTKLTAADAKVEQAYKDLELLAKGPEVTPLAMNDMLARRQTTVSAGATSDTASKTAVDDKGVTRTTTTVANEMTQDGASATSTHATSTEVGLTGGSHKTSDEKKVVSGDKTTTNSSSTTSALDLTKGNFSHSTTGATSSDDASKLDGSGKTGTSTTKGLELGPGGITSSTSTTETKGKDKATTANSDSVVRGDGKLGVSNTKSNSVENGDGSGSSSSTTTSGGIIADKNSLGAFGNAETSGDKKFANGLSVKGKAAAGGKCVYSIEPILGTDPTQYELRGTLTLDASVSGGGGYEYKKDDATTGSASVGANASAKVVATFGQKLDAAGVARWKEQLAQAEAGNGSGGHPFNLIATGVREGWSQARRVYDGMKSGEGVTKTLQDGESRGLSLEARGGANVDASAKGGGGSFGAGAGYDKGRVVEGNVRRDGDTTTTERKVTDDDALSGNVKGGMGVASMSIGGKLTSKKGTGYTFKVPDDYPDAAAVRLEAEQLVTQEELDDFARRHPKLVSGKAVTDGSGKDLDVGLGVGPGSATLTAGGSQESERGEEYDKDGNVIATTEKHTGESHIGGKLALGPLAIGSNSKEQVVASVRTDKNGNQSAQADVSDTDTESGYDLDGTITNISKLGDKTVENLTGKSPILAKKDKTEVAGFFLDDSDFQTIIDKAKDPAKWSKGFSRVANMEDWNTLRSEINAAGGDKNLVAAALKRWGGGGEHGRNKNLEELLGVHSGGGGDRYEFPDGAGDLKPLYLKLVVGSPMDEVEKLLFGGHVADAAQLATALADQCWKLLTDLQNKRGEFDNANVYGEMVTRAGKREGELRVRGSVLAANADDKDVSPESIDRLRDTTEFNRLAEVCRELARQEARLFEKIAANHEGMMGNHSEPENVKMVNELRANAKLWEPQYNEMIRLANQYGFTFVGETFRGWKPDKVKLQFAYAGKNPNSAEATTAQHEADVGEKQATESNVNAGKALSESLAVTAGMQKNADGSYFGKRSSAEQAAWDKQEYERLRPIYDTNYKKQEPLVAAARAAATQAKGKCNMLTSTGNWDRVSKAALGPYNQGYALFGAAERSWQAAVQALKSTDLKGLQRYWYAAQSAPRDFNEAAESFKKGDALQG